VTVEDVMSVTPQIAGKIGRQALPQAGSRWIDEALEKYGGGN
jgi:hypothetical protein